MRNLSRREFLSLSAGTAVGFAADETLSRLTKSSPLKTFDTDPGVGSIRISMVVEPVTGRQVSPQEVAAVREGQLTEFFALNSASILGDLIHRISEGEMTPEKTKRVGQVMSQAFWDIDKELAT